ncbi:MAG: hypothetical protein SOR79_09930 [Blautia sp.]|nr:hypothetical protein [Blautia sp.]MDY3017451.1 hypothetical protein [Blautia sp.]
MWIEDRKEKASYTFWENFMRQLCPDVIVESKKNNSELVKSVRTLQDTENRYIIVFDNSFDNLQIVMEKKRLKKYVNEKENVFLLNIICFEYLLLEFKELIEWIYAPEDEFLQKRAKAIAAKLLFDLTRNTGFEVSKGILGECWIKSCCEWDERQEDDICGLDYNRLSVFDKMKRIYEESSLKLQFPKVGLEVMA